MQYMQFMHIHDGNYLVSCSSIVAFRFDTRGGTCGDMVGQYPLPDCKLVEIYDLGFKLNVRIWVNSCGRNAGKWKVEAKKS